MQRFTGSVHEKGAVAAMWTVSVSARAWGEKRRHSLAAIPIASAREILIPQVMITTAFHGIREKMRYCCMTRCAEATGISDSHGCGSCPRSDRVIIAPT